MRTISRICAILSLMISLLNDCNAQQISVEKLIEKQDTIYFTLKEGNDLIIGKSSHITKDSLLGFISLYSGIRTPNGFNKHIFLSVTRSFDTRTLSYDGDRNVLENGCGITKLFSEELGSNTTRIFKDSLLISYYEIFENDTLNYFDFFDPRYKMIVDRIVDIFKDRFDHGKYSGSNYFVIDENNILSYIIVSEKKRSNDRTIEKVKIPKKDRYHFNNLPERRGKVVIALHIGQRPIN